MSSDRFDNTWFIPAENINVEILACEPPDELLGSGPDELLGSGPDFVNQTKDSDRFPVEGHRKDRPRFPAQFFDSGMFAKV